MTQASCLYEGRVRHRRRRPRAHAFEYRLFLSYLDLDELPALFSGHWLFSATLPAPARFRREDHLGDPARPLADCVRELVKARLGRRPVGPIRLLTHLRTFGVSFNPVSFYYCFASDGETLEALVAEVDNTPWGERHCYVLDAPRGDHGDGTFHYRLAKEFHVSPFMPMEIDYAWRFSQPGAQLLVHMQSYAEGSLLFDVTLSLERREFGNATLRSALARFPLLTAKVFGAIYFEAARLWWNDTPFHPHPRTMSPANREITG